MLSQDLGFCQRWETSGRPPSRPSNRGLLVPSNCCQRPACLQCRTCIAAQLVGAPNRLGPGTPGTGKKYPALPGEGAVPFVLCWHCLQLLEVPAYLPPARAAGGTCRKLRCGSCKKLLKFSSSLQIGGYGLGEKGRPLVESHGCSGQGDLARRAGHTIHSSSCSSISDKLAFRTSSYDSAKNSDDSPDLCSSGSPNPSSTHTSPYPSLYPTSHPSLFPSGHPSPFPSRHPSLYPSTYPSRHTGLYPSTYPSRYTILSPSTQPSLYPSRHPSLPSTYPSLFPSTQPSLYPSRHPSLSPSTEPTQPSLSSSRHTSLFSSRHTSLSPSTEPSPSPGTQPSLFPSAQPNLYPSSHPSPCPSSHPSLNPRGGVHDDSEDGYGSFWSPAPGSPLFKHLSYGYSRGDFGVIPDRKPENGGRKGGIRYLAWLWKRGPKELSSSISNGTVDSEVAVVRNVVVNGQVIPEEDLWKAEDLAGRIHSGSYWYDYQAGFWGVAGGPCLGILPPCIDQFRYPMARECANGRTGILVNGRELHESDLKVLSRRGLPETPGKSYAIEISGSVVDVDTGEVRNLRSLAPTVLKRGRGYGMFQPSLLQKTK